MIFFTNLNLYGSVLSGLTSWPHFAGLCIIFFLLFSGFLIVKTKVPDWWIWVYYISPLQWAITAIVCNEFLSDRYSQVSGISKL
jgi:ABC-type multidrug transport system permease subunit